MSSVETDSIAMGSAKACAAKVRSCWAKWLRVSAVIIEHPRIIITIGDYIITYYYFIIIITFILCTHIRQ